MLSFHTPLLRQLLKCNKPSTVNDDNSTELFEYMHNTNGTVVCLSKYVMSLYPTMGLL